MANYGHGERLSIVELLAQIPKSKKKLRQSLEKIADTGVRSMNVSELKSVGSTVIREARRRMRELERTGREDSPAYEAYRARGLKTSLQGSDINKLKHELKEAYEFITRKTSTTEGTDLYNQWLDEHLGAETTKEQRAKIWDIVNRIEIEHPNLFINYGYNETISKISDIAASTGFNVDLSYEIFKSVVEGTLKTERDGMEFGKELNEGTVSGWMRKSGLIID